MHEYFYRFVLKHPHTDELRSVRCILRAQDRAPMERDGWVNGGLTAQYNPDSPESAGFRRAIRPASLEFDAQVTPEWGRISLTETKSDGRFLRKAIPDPQVITHFSPGPYVFIHPTKTGGTALGAYLNNNYGQHISGAGHLNRSEDAVRWNRTACMIVRDPVDRFLSI